MVSITPPSSGAMTPAGKAASLLKPLDPDKAKKLADTKQVLQQTLSAMKNGKNAIGQQRKAMAAQRVAQIKAAIKTLRQTPGADPKTIARMAARLAEDLAAALKDYASAGATSTEISSASGGDTAAPAPTPAAAGSETAAADPKDAGDGDIAAAATPPETDLAFAPAADQAEDEAVPAPFKAYQQVQNLTTDASSSQDQTKTIRKKDDDSGFIKEAKDAMEELRNLIKMQRARSGPRKAFDNDPVSDAESAMKELDRAFTAMTRAVSGPIATV